MAKRKKTTKKESNFSVTQAAVNSLTVYGGVKAAQQFDFLTDTEETTLALISAAIGVDLEWIGDSDEDEDEE